MSRLFIPRSYLELALNGPLDGETRENLTRSHTASKVFCFSSLLRTGSN